MRVFPRRHDFTGFRAIVLPLIHRACLMRRGLTCLLRLWLARHPYFFFKAVSYTRPNYRLPFRSAISRESLCKLHLAQASTAAQHTHPLPLAFSPSEPSGALPYFAPSLCVSRLFLPALALIPVLVWALPFRALQASCTLRCRMSRMRKCLVSSSICSALWRVPHSDQPD